MGLLCLVLFLLVLFFAAVAEEEVPSLNLVWKIEQIISIIIGTNIWRRQQHGLTRRVPDKLHFPYALMWMPLQRQFREIEMRKPGKMPGQLSSPSLSEPRPHGPIRTVGTAPQFKQAREAPYT